MIGVDALQWIRDQGGIHEIEINGRAYTLEKLNEIYLSHEHQVETLVFNTLDGLVSYAASQFVHDLHAGAGNAAFQVCGPGEVRLLGRLQPNNHNVRWCYAKAKLVEDPFSFGQAFSQEDFIIQLMGKFVHDDNLMALVGMVASITSVMENKSDDDGISPMIEIRKGLRLREEKKLENPITLAPWRTFREVEQPASEFVIRIDDNERRGGINCRLYEADGAVWKLNAITAIGDFLDMRMHSSSWPEGHNVNVFC